MIRLDKVCLQHGAFRLEQISLQIETGAYGVLMGATGSGKTSLLEAICGLRPVRDGTIWLQGRDVTRLRPAERGIGYVPQDIALFPHMTVAEHLAFGPLIQRWGAADREARVRELSQQLGITALLSRRPAGLSGGEAQRVSLGRALAPRPGILLLDEPLSALDDTTRAEMTTLLRSLPRLHGVTTLHVTHSGVEATRLADTLLMLHNGALQVVDTPRLSDQVDR